MDPGLFLLLCLWGKASLSSGTAGGPGKEAAGGGSWEFKATKAKKALHFLQSLLEPNRVIFTPSFFIGAKPLPGSDRRSQEAQAALF